jgi:hypothetical protein
VATSDNRPMDADLLARGQALIAEGLTLKRTTEALMAQDGIEDAELDRRIARMMEIAAELDRIVALSRGQRADN